MKYPPRPGVNWRVVLCKCGHYYMSHDYELFPGNWLQRNCVFFWKSSEGGKECKRCMCPQFEQDNTIDGNFSNEIKERSK